MIRRGYRLLRCLLLGLIIIPSAILTQESQDPGRHPSNLKEIRRGMFNKIKNIRSLRESFQHPVPPLHTRNLPRQSGVSAQDDGRFLLSLGKLSTPGSGTRLLHRSVQKEKSSVQKDDIRKTLLTTRLRANRRLRLGNNPPDESTVLEPEKKEPLRGEEKLPHKSRRGESQEDSVVQDTVVASSELVKHLSETSFGLQSPSNIDMSPFDDGHYLSLPTRSLLAVTSRDISNGQGGIDFGKRVIPNRRAKSPTQSRTPIVHARNAPVFKRVTSASNRPNKPVTPVVQDRTTSKVDRMIPDTHVSSSLFVSSITPIIRFNEPTIIDRTTSDNPVDVPLIISSTPPNLEVKNAVIIDRMAPDTQVTEPSVVSDVNDVIDMNKLTWTGQNILSKQSNGTVNHPKSGAPNGAVAKRSRRVYERRRTKPRRIEQNKHFPGVNKPHLQTLRFSGEDVSHELFGPNKTSWKWNTPTRVSKWRPIKTNARLVVSTSVRNEATPVYTTPNTNVIREASDHSNTISEAVVAPVKSTISDSGAIVETPHKEHVSEISPTEPSPSVLHIRVPPSRDESDQVEAELAKSAEKVKIAEQFVSPRVGFSRESPYALFEPSFQFPSVMDVIRDYRANFHKFWETGTHDGVPEPRDKLFYLSPRDFAPRNFFLGL